jgi:hypothetical protein
LKRADKCRREKGSHGFFYIISPYAPHRQFSAN